MTTNHHQLPLDEVEAGAILSEDVRDDNGVVLLTSGTCLSAPLLTSLGRHGVETVWIESAEEVADQGQQDQEDQEDQQLQQQLERLKSLFRLETCDEASSLLHVYVEQYRTGVTA